MGTWDDVRKEVLAENRDGGTGESGPDVVRRRKILRVEQITEVPLVVYASCFIDDTKAARVGAALQIDLSDKTGFNQATSDIPDGPLDVILHSPGGSPTATESLNQRQGGMCICLRRGIVLGIRQQCFGP